MIALVKKNPSNKQTQIESDGFLALLPQIRRQASYAFRRFGVEARDDLTHEVIVNAYSAWVRLVDQGRAAIAKPTPLAQFAIRQVRDGRRIGARMNVNDISSLHSRRAHGIKVERIDQRNPRTGGWVEFLIEDRHSGPAEIAAARIDVSDWLRSLTNRNRQMAKALALGETTCDVARKFGLCPGRVSQLRVWLRTHWEKFQGATESMGCVA